MIITIDGPCVSGKSSVARQIALRLGICHFSTGLLYRAVAYIVINILLSKIRICHTISPGLSFPRRRESGLKISGLNEKKLYDPRLARWALEDDNPRIKNLWQATLNRFRKKFDTLHKIKGENYGVDLSSLDFNFISEISCVVKNQTVSIFFRQIDITPFLADDQLSLSASALSALPEVRQRLLDLQREIGRRYSIVVDGRDCGSVVFPQADFKFFLTASIDARVQRVMNDPKRATIYHDYDHARDELLKRDERDSRRALAPLIVPDGSVVIDSSDLTFEQTVEKFLEIIQNK